MPGRSFRNGTPSSVFSFVVSVIPPINATPPSLISNLVLSCFVDIGGGLLPVPTLSLLTATSNYILPSSIIWGVTLRVNAAVLNYVVGVDPAWATVL